MTTMAQAQLGAMPAEKVSLLSGPSARVQCTRLHPKRDGFSQLLLDIALWRSLVFYLGSPFRRLFAFALLSGGSGSTLLVHTLEVVWRGLGWLSASPESPPFRRLERYLTGLKRWHLAVGEHPCQAAGPCQSCSYKESCAAAVSASAAV